MLPFLYHAIQLAITIKNFGDLTLALISLPPTIVIATRKRIGDLIINRE